MTASAFLTGIGGGVYALALRYVSPYDVFGNMFSTTLMLGTLLGGRGTVYGPIIGFAGLFVPAGRTLFAPTAAAHDSPTAGDSIKIGIFGPFTGPIALYGKTAHLNHAVFEEMVNKSGGIHGRKIETILEDDGCEPVKGVAAVKKLIYQDKVFMLSGGLCSNVVLAAKKEIVQAGIPLVGMGAVADAIYEPVEKNVFTSFISASYIARAMVDFGMSKPGVKRVAIIKQTDEWGTSNYNPLAKYLKEKYNIKKEVMVSEEES
jgi:branched-chain amino acid transport system substrate-binding protein